MRLDLTSLEIAVFSLRKAIERSTRDPHDEEVRDAVIQRFEYTYELCWKMLKRQLEQEVPNPSEIDQFSYRDLLREAAERQMLGTIEEWMGFRNLRNITAHAYDRKKAMLVLDASRGFLAEAEKLLAELQKRNRA